MAKKRQRNLILIGIVILLGALILIPQLRDVVIYDDEKRQFIRKDGFIIIPEDSPIRERIKVGEVVKDSLSRSVSAPASVEANPAKRANIFPPVGGRIVSLYVNMGDNIRSGQALFEIYSPDIAEVQTEFISARSALAQAERDLRRKEDLHEKGITPLRELEEAKTEYEIAQSEMEGALLKMRIMGLSVDDIGKPLIVTSPINGRLVDLSVAQGEFIAEPEEPLMVVADLSNVWVTANIQEKDIRFISTGMKAEARFPAYPGEAYTGEVLFVSDILDTESRTTKAIIQFENPDIKLKPGMFANVIFQTAAAASLIVPPNAVLQRRDYNYVYVESESFKFEKRIIRTGEIIDNKLIVVEGLSEGERIITENAVLLP